MQIKDIKLKKWSNKDVVNNIISAWLTLDDDIYLGNKHKHNWKCKCGNVIEGRMWDKIKSRNSFKCGECIRQEIRDKHKTIVESYSDYIYIQTYFTGDIFPNGNVAETTYIQVEHEYCGNIYIIKTRSFINMGNRCGDCCQTYENSFAYHIEVELGEPLEKYWDFEKNTVNPYHISMGRNATNRNGDNLKVWIKCQENDYHGSYEISCDKFVRGSRCGYCKGDVVLHPKDSFGQYLEDNNILYLWSKKNTFSPYSVSKGCSKKVWMLCDNVDYHNEYGGYETRCSVFIRNHRCPYCCNQKVHPKDSFGVVNPEEAIYWSDLNNNSPYDVAPFSKGKYYFVCGDCGHNFKSTLSNVSNGTWCPVCASSKGEKRVRAWLEINNIYYIHDEPYFEDLIGTGGGVLRPDFILPEHKIWIEYDGEFHYEPINGEESLKKQQYHDKLKDKYSKKNGYRMIRIPYWDFDNIEKILKLKL